MRGAPFGQMSQLYDKAAVAKMAAARQRTTCLCLSQWQCASVRLAICPLPVQNQTQESNAWPLLRPCLTQALARSLLRLPQMYLTACRPWPITPAHAHAVHLSLSTPCLSQASTRNVSRHTCPCPRARLILHHRPIPTQAAAHSAPQNSPQCCIVVVPADLHPAPCHPFPPPPPPPRRLQPITHRDGGAVLPPSITLPAPLSGPSQADYLVLHPWPGIQRLQVPPSPSWAWAGGWDGSPGGHAARSDRRGSRRRPHPHPRQQQQQQQQQWRHLDHGTPRDGQQQHCHDIYRGNEEQQHQQQRAEGQGPDSQAQQPHSSHLCPPRDQQQGHAHGAFLAASSAPGAERGAASAAAWLVHDGAQGVVEGTSEQPCCIEHSSSSSSSSGSGRKGCGCAGGMIPGRPRMHGRLEQAPPGPALDPGAGCVSDGHDPGTSSSGRGSSSSGKGSGSDSSCSGKDSGFGSSVGKDSGCWRPRGPSEQLCVSPNHTVAYLTQSIMPQHANTLGITFGGQVCARVSLSCLGTQFAYVQPGHMHNEPTLVSIAGVLLPQLSHL